MDIQNWVNTVVHCTADDNPPQHESRIVDPTSSSPKRKKFSSNSLNSHGRILPPPNRAHTSKVRKSVTRDTMKGRKLEKDSKIRRSVEIFTCGKGGNDNSSNEYRKKPRRKTRADRYDLKDEKKHYSKIISKSKRATKKPGKRNGCKEKANSDWPIPLGSKYLRMTGLCPSRPRLSLPTKEKFGSQCKAQSAQMRPGQRAEKQKCYCGQGRQKSNHKTRSCKQVMQEEVSGFFIEGKAPLIERDINVVPNDNSSRNVMSEYVLKTKALDLTEVRNLADLEKRHLDFTRREQRPKSSTSSTSSSYRRRSSIPAVDIRSKTIRTDHLTEFPQCSVNTNLENEAIRSVSAQRTNCESDKNRFTKIPLKTKEAVDYPEKLSSPLLMAHPAVDTGWRQDGLIDSTKPKRMTRGSNGKAQNFNDDSSLHDVVKLRAASKTPVNFDVRERSDSELQEDGKLCRSSSQVGRLLKECDNALAQRPHEEVLPLSDIATNDQKWIPGSTKVSSSHNVRKVTPLYEPEIKLLNYFYRKPYGPYGLYSHQGNLEPSPVNKMKTWYNNDTQNLQGLHCRLGNDPSVGRSSDHELITSVGKEIPFGFWKPQNLY